jgi:anaerobic magnesium-protoporphyrin IX monomethyl ester cyclase
MVDMLHAHGNHLFYDRKQVQRMKPYPPLRTLLAAALMRQNGVSVAAGDVNLEPPEQKFGAALDSCPPCWVLVCEEDFGYLTKTCLGRNRELWVAQAAHACGIAAAVHRSDSSDYAAEYFRAGFDHVPIGEVEAPLLEPAQAKLIGQSVGLTFNDLATGQLRFNVPRAHRADLEFRIQGRHSRHLYQHDNEPRRSGMAEAPDPNRIHAARLSLLTREEVEA